MTPQRTAAPNVNQLHFLSASFLSSSLSLSYHLLLLLFSSHPFVLYDYFLVCFGFSLDFWLLSVQVRIAGFTTLLSNVLLRPDIFGPIRIAAFFPSIDLETLR